MADTHYVIGVDGGGTSTRAALMSVMRTGDGNNQLTLLAARRLPQPSNPVVSGRAAAYETIRAVLADTIAESGVDASRIGAICLAIAGTGAQAEQQALDAWMKSVRLTDRKDVSPTFASATVRIATDAEAVLAMCPSSQPSAVLIAGTGSVALARSASGDVVQVGGWGPTADDPGSAFWIAVQALRRACRMADGREPDTGLGTAIVEHFRNASLRQLCDDVHSGRIDRRRLATSAAVVARLCETGDPAALEIRLEAAAELSHLVTTAVRQSGLSDDVFAIRLAGGLFNNEELTSKVTSLLAKSLPKVQAGGGIVRIESAEEGAARLAAERLS